MRNREPPSPFALSASEVMAGLWESRLFPGEELRRLSAERGTDDGPAWTQDLVRRGALTAFQAEQLLAGNGDRLVLGGYRILERLGEGGMGQVFRAEHQLMKRVVALKVIAGGPFQAGAPWHDSSTNFDIFLPNPRTASLAPDDLAAFHREVRAAGRLRHPNIVTAYDAAEDRGIHFLVMEYVPGVDLGRLVRESGPLPVALACEYVRQAAQGLQYAHEQGVVHRDVKPSNLLLTWEGAGVDRRTTLVADRHVVKLLDLGLARLRDQSREDDAGSEGVLCGTPDFLAPEVGEDSRIVDIRADLYSLGCTFYYLLTGHTPFPGGAWTAKLVRHRLDAPPPLTNFRDDVPGEVSTVLERLLAKDPVNRYQVPADLIAALPREIEESENVPPAFIVASPAAEVRTPDLSVEGTWPTLDDLPLGAPAEKPPVRSSRARALVRKTAIVAAALSVSALIGLVLAGLARHWEDKEPVRAAPPVASINGPAPSKAAAPTPQPFEVHGTRYTTLPGALAAASDGDTVTIHGDDPISMGPVTLRDKAVTLQAAAGERPCLNLVPSTEPRPRQALLASNRSLTLVGLDLAYEPPAGPKTPREPVHLVFCENASLRILDCRLTAPRLIAPVICRQCPSVEVRDCRLTAAASGLCVDLGDGAGCEVILNGNQITMEEREGAAVSLWAAESRRPASPRFMLDRNNIIAGRVLACAGSAAGLDVTANGNEITFRQALVSQAGVVEPGRIVWRGRDNTYRPADDWLCVDGKPGGVRGLAAWRAHCGDEETGSRER
jgi:serine/threonine protein kinase